MNPTEISDEPFILHTHVCNNMKTTTNATVKDAMQSERIAEIASELIAMSNVGKSEYSYMVMQAGAILREVAQGTGGGHFDWEYITNKTRKLEAAAVRIAKARHA